MRGKTRWPARKVAIQNYSEVWTSLKFYVLIGHDWEAGGKRLPTCPFLEHRASLEFFSHFFQSVRVLKPLRGEWARPKHTQSNRIPLPGPRDPGPPRPAGRDPGPGRRAGRGRRSAGWTAALPGPCPGSQDLSTALPGPSPARRPDPAPARTQAPRPAPRPGCASPALPGRVLREDGGPWQAGAARVRGGGRVRRGGSVSGEERPARRRAHLSAPPPPPPGRRPPQPRCPATAPHADGLWGRGGSRGAAGPDERRGSERRGLTAGQQRLLPVSGRKGLNLATPAPQRSFPFAWEHTAPASGTCRKSLPSRSRARYSPLGPPTGARRPYVMSTWRLDWPSAAPGPPPPLGL